MSEEKKKEPLDGLARSRIEAGAYLGAAQRAISEARGNHWNHQAKLDSIDLAKAALDQARLRVQHMLDNADDSNEMPF